MTDAALPPPLIPGMPGLGRQPVLVTGGTGTIGSQVVVELLESQIPARVLTRLARPGAAPGAQLVEGDLLGGAGLEEALTGVQAVIHCASDAKQGRAVDVEGTGRLTEAMAQVAPDARLVHVSIVGCWDNPLPYYRVKAESETVVTASGRPHVIVRATQVHELVERIVGAHLGRLSIGLRGLRFAPCDSRWLATELVDAAFEEQVPAEPPELAGPEVLSARELAVLTAHVQGRGTPRQVRLPRVGGILRGLAEGSNLPGPQARRGGRTYAQWLADQRR
ncbi:NAD(P)H-binding protein [Flexivirga sp. ID2601S]|uniref:NAD(P)H-binding protein n=1 Tax=Flexivirga aerilata TaxID=1656889 RepID=A0A849AL00_9MICO|nr:NAD(P)H-binding protein [Flexivirga aerilata]NNG40206.1 NAD(P)H-binding protein [Flexivirga aerilata]